MGTPPAPGTPSHQSPPPPRFSDVVEAQRWASQVVQQAEEQANRRGCRGSPAWEDAWRDALWTLAVQKRCVEVEARKRVEGAAAMEGAVFGGSTGSDSKARDMSPRQSGAHAPFGGTTGGPGSTQSFGARQEVQEALRQSTEAFERHCLEPVRCRLDSFEERLARLSATLQGAPAPRGSGSPLLKAEEAAEASVSQAFRSPSGSSNLYSAGSAGPLPTGARQALRSSSCKVAAGQEEEELWRSTAGPSWSDTLPSCSATALRSPRPGVSAHFGEAKAEAAWRGEAERRLRAVEAEREEARQKLRKVELLLEEVSRQRADAEASWRQRHATLERQLRRTEVALGEAHLASDARSVGLPLGRGERAAAWCRQSSASHDRLSFTANQEQETLKSPEDMCFSGLLRPGVARHPRRSVPEHPSKGCWDEQGQADEADELGEPEGEVVAALGGSRCERRLDMDQDLAVGLAPADRALELWRAARSLSKSPVRRRVAPLLRC
ncbi:unnamed protein product [Polarella glacialis]|uniref:Uncharacterized protein n=1 Tax=Polarella glacialis TaxID=89957 RepID=A0A813IHX7_POLGL|nr:unnamed protein product [Polarella glacialis]CAE8650293.1 unnamed protein product [Polarella glacialis]